MNPEKIKKIEDNIKTRPITYLNGGRQVGKSTEVYKLVDELGFHYVSLDNLRERQLAILDPEFFIQQHGFPLIIDEIQYAPKLLEVIESIVNKERLKNGNANGMFILTGSQSFNLMQGVTQSLAGRASILKMMPLSYSETINKVESPFVPSMEKFREKTDVIDVNKLFKMIVRGFYPELYNNNNLDTYMFYENYVNTYLDRDVTQIINIRNKLVFHNFMQYIASITSQQVNYTDISRGIGVDVNTVKSWISVLEANGIIYLLQPYSEAKLTKRMVKSPKIYFCYTGLAAHLAKVDNPEYLAISNLSGAFMENYVMNEIKKSYYNYFNETPMDIDSAHALIGDPNNIALDKDRLNDLIEIINELQNVKIETEAELNQWLANMGDTTYPMYDNSEIYEAGQIVRDGDGDYLYMCRYDDTTGVSTDDKDSWVAMSTNTLGVDWSTEISSERKVGSAAYYYRTSTVPVGKVDIPLEADDAYTEIDNGVTYYHLDGDVLTFMQNDDSGNTYELYPTIKAENVTTDMSSVTSLTSFGANLAETLIRDYQTVKFK